MNDLGAQYTDEELKKFEKRIDTIYKQADKDITAKMKDFNQRYAAKEAKYAADVKAGKISQKDFDAWKAGQVFQGKQWQAKKEQIANVLYNSNTIATNILNGQMTNVFAENANFMSYTMESGKGINFGFGLYDSATVANLLKNEPKLLKSVGKGKDTAWNQKKVTRQVTQGIIQGESLDKIADRLGNVLSSQNKNSMMTAARTSMTAAQNAGRQEAFSEAEELGINLQKEWMATFDEHTRMTHRDLDGQRVPNNDYFEVDEYTIRYPGDPEAATEMIINCRCTMVADIVDYPSTFDRYDNIDGIPIEGMTYNEWKAAKAAGLDISPKPLSWKTFKTDYEQEIADLFAGKKMSNVYDEMKAYDTKTATEFYGELKKMGKPSEVWTSHLNGTLPTAQSQKIDDMLKKYAEGSKLVTPPKKMVEVFANKKMSNVYNEMKTLDTKMANQFYNELKSMGKPSEVWQQYLDGKLGSAETKKIESYLLQHNNAMKKGAITPPKLSKTAKSAKSATTLEEAQEALKNAQNAISDAGANKEFEGIWKDKVTYADYSAKKGSIQFKKEYYESQIAKYKGPAYENVSWASGKVKELEGYLKNLEEFEKNGPKYEKLFKELEAAKTKVKELTPIKTSGTLFDSDAYSDKVKAAAKSFLDKDDADKFHREYLDKIWDTLTDEEKYSVWEYTRNSNPMNKSLSGYHDTWDRRDFLGPLNTKWGHEDPWRSIPSNFEKFGKSGHVSYHGAITNATKAIEKSTLPQGVKLVRGSDKGGFAGMIEGDLFSYEQASKLLNASEKELKAALEGQIIQNHAFTSTGIARGTGFSGDVTYTIYCPKGTKAIYAEPQSYYGDTHFMQSVLYKKGDSYRSVGGEAEVIIQRGTEFRITNVTKSSRTIHVEMEVVAQPRYFKYGDENTFNAGSTRHKN